MSDAEMSKIRLFELNILQQKLNLAIKEKKISVIFAPVFLIVLGIWCVMTIYSTPKDIDADRHPVGFYAYIILIIVLFIIPTVFLITSVVNSDADIIEYKEKIAQKEKTLNQD